MLLTIEEVVSMQSSFMEFKFGKLHYQHAFSDKKKTILFLHAFHSSATSFSKVCDLLQDNFNLVCLDLPGHGLSEHVDIAHYSWYYSFAGFTEILIEFVDRLQLKELFIVGDSAGGNSAVRAMPSLKMLEGLILLGSIQAESKDKAFEQMFPSEALTLLFQKELTDEQCAVLAAAYVDPAKNEQENFKQMLYDIKHTDSNCREQFGHYVETQEWIDELQLIKKSRVPVMYILGLQDGFINVVAYKKMLIEAGLQESQIQVLDQARHVPQLDDPEVCAQLILKFIETVCRN